MKKILSVLLIFIMLFTLVGCESSKEIDLSTKEIIDKLYDDAGELPSLMNSELNEDNVSWYLGTDQVEFSEGYISEPAMSSQAYLIVVLKVKEGVSVDDTMELIKNSVDPNRWICADAEDVRVINRGNTILLLMMDEEYKVRTDKIEDNFKNM